MNEDTKKLLQECTSGCKMATESMLQLEKYIEDKKLFEVVQSYKQKHAQLEQEAAQMLGEAGNREKEPDKMASAFSWITTEVKMMIEDDSHQIAKIMMNGCNMGIQSISECLNEHESADEKAKSIAKKLVKIEEDFMKEMKAFL